MKTTQMKKMIRNLLSGVIIGIISFSSGFAQLANGTYIITATHSNKVLDVPNATANDNIQLQQWEYNGSTAQKWVVESLGGGQYSIKTAVNNKAVIVQNSSTSNGGAVVLLGYSGANNHKWTITQVSGNVYKVINVNSGKGMDVSTASQNNGGLVHQWDYLSGTNQQWKFESAGGITPPPASNLTAPAALGSNNITNNSINLTWWSVTNAVNYNIYNGSTKLGSSTNGWTNYNVTSLNSGTSYTFTVKALNSSNQEGPGSNITVSTSGTTDGGGGGTPPPPATNGCMAVGANLGGDFQWTSDGTDLRVFKSDVTNWSTETNPWNPAFLTDISGTSYKMFRFMDWGSINWSREVTWSDRTAKTENHTNYAQWFGRAIAYEWMVDLCNRTNKHMWINIPHRADDNYVTQLATLLKNSLNSNLNIYVEYSNETWNYTFQSKTENGGMNGQLNWVQAEGARLGLPGAPKDYQGQSYYVYRSLQIFKRFNDVFGSSSGRLRKVLAYSGNEDVARQSLNIIDNSTYNPNNIKPDIFAVAPYIGSNGTITTGNASADFRSKVDGSVASGGYTQMFKGVVDAYNNAHPNNKMVFSIYEAGQHYSQGGSNQKNFSDNPNAYNDYMYMLNAFKPYYNTFMQFVHAAKCDENDCWGAKAYYGQTNATKYNALKDFMSANNCGVAREEAKEIETSTSSVILFPNPATNKVTVNVNTGEVAILNLDGTVLASKISDGSALEFDLSGFNSGIYLVKAGTKVFKLIKE